MKLDLTNFAYELSEGMYQGCTLGDALAKEFVIQTMEQISTTNASIAAKQREQAIENFLKKQQ